MKLILIRHGQTDWNTKGKIQGSCDIELNEVGILQAEELSQKIVENNYRFERIYTSSQQRAIQTAEIISRVTNVGYVADEGLKEINFGEWEGLTWKEVKEKYPLEYQEWYINRRYTTPPNGESYQAMLERALNSIKKIIHENSKDIIVITHSAIIMCIQCYLTDTPFNEMTKFKAENTSITEIECDILLSKI